MSLTRTQYSSTTLWAIAGAGIGGTLGALSGAALATYLTFSIGLMYMKEDHNKKPRSSPHFFRNCIIGGGLVGAAAGAAIGGGANYFVDTCISYFTSNKR